MPLLPRTDQRPLRTVLIYAAGSAEASFAAAACADCASSAEEAVAAGEALAGRLGRERPAP